MTELCDKMDGVANQQCSTLLATVGNALYAVGGK